MSFTDAADHRDRMRKLAHMATWHAVSHDHGSGRVVLGEDGEAVVRLGARRPDRPAVAARAHVELARLHHDGRRRGDLHVPLAPRALARRRGLRRLPAPGSRTTPPEEYTAYSAHQMGSCRLGADPATSVADGRGELHDTPGVWVGDASALPTAPGVNPMLTIMALAELTAGHILAA